MEEFKRPDLPPPGAPRGPSDEPPGKRDDKGEKNEQEVKSKRPTTTLTTKTTTAEPKDKVPVLTAAAAEEKRRYEEIREKVRAEHLGKYKEPPTKAIATDPRYYLEELKNGTIVSKKTLTDKSLFTVGRFDVWDIVAENPTVSRMHAIIQYIGRDSDVEEGSEFADCQEKGFYLYDLNSSHGTYLNKLRLYPNKYYRLRVGHVIKFGNSSRLYAVNGPDNDVEEENPKSVTELLKERAEKEIRLRAEKMALGVVQDDQEDRKVVEKDDGVSWGMSEDADAEEDINSVNPFSIDIDTDVNFDNPKKTLKNWFEREGQDLFYDCREKGNNRFICRIELPLESTSATFAEVEVQGKKKEAVFQCALKACQMLDKYGVLRQTSQEAAAKRKKRNWEEQDFYDSDEDNFLDRTGNLEKKRIKRMKEVGKIVEDKVENYDSLMNKLALVEKDIKDIEEDINKAEIKNKQNAGEDVDPLDAYMTEIKSGAIDIKALRRKLKQFSDEGKRLQKLINITKPSTYATENKPLPAPVPVSTPPTPIVKISKNINIKSFKMAIKGPSLSSTDHQQKEVPNTNVESSDKDMSTNVHKNPEIGQDKMGSSSSKSMEVEVKKKQTQQQQQQQQSKQDNLPAVKFQLKNPKRKVQDDPSDSDSSDSGDEKKKKALKSKKKKGEKKYEYDASNPAYSLWLPPDQNQSGDGRTSLNEKLGY